LRRLSNGFSKRLFKAPFQNALETTRRQSAWMFAHYNLRRAHEALRNTPAMALGVADDVWSIMFDRSASYLMRRRRRDRSRLHLPHRIDGGSSGSLKTGGSDAGTLIFSLSKFFRRPKREASAGEPRPRQSNARMRRTFSP